MRLRLFIYPQLHEGQKKLTRTLSAQISKFFEKSDEVDALLFLTFSFDEMVLVKLLQTHKVAESKRVVVFHDILRHKNPGFLRHWYPNSNIVAVKLKATNGDKHCPVFHTKMWMHVKQEGLKCTKLAINSLNLSRGHFDKCWHTVESFAIWEQLDLSLPMTPFLSWEIIFKNKDCLPIVIQPETLFIDGRSGTVRTIRRHKESVCRVLEMIVKDKPVGCAAPFIHITAVKKLTKEYMKLRIWRQAKKSSKTGMHLHAKFIEYRKLLVFGSANITKQAIIGDTDNGEARAINHEVAVLVNKKVELKSLLGGFKSEWASSLENQDNDAGCDPNFEDSNGIVDWSEQRRMAINAPSRVKLMLHNGKAEIVVIGRCKKYDRIEFRNSYNDQNQKSSVIVNQKSLGNITVEQQKALAKVVLSPPVKVIGLKGYKKRVWESELDLGELWPILNCAWRSISSRKEIKSSDEKIETGAKSKKRRSVCC